MLDLHPPSSGLLNRDSEREALDRLVAGVRAGQSRVLVLRGEAGVGKSALLRHLSRAASGCQIARAAGVESEMELAFAGLHGLCAPLLTHLGRLPTPAEYFAQYQSKIAPREEQVYRYLQFDELPEYQGLRVVA